MLTQYRTHKTMTGKILLVLQIGECSVTGDHDDIQPSGRNLPYIHWRDATVSDLILDKENTCE